MSSHPYPSTTSGSEKSEAQDKALLPLSKEGSQYKTVFRLLTSNFGVDFTHYKRSTIQRRLLRRVALRQKETLADYVELLQTDSGEVQALFNDLLIRVTSFFRDPAIFDGLTKIVFPTLLEATCHSGSIANLDSWLCLRRGSIFRCHLLDRIPERQG